MTWTDEEVWLLTSRSISRTLYEIVDAYEKRGANQVHLGVLLTIADDMSKVLPQSTKEYKKNFVKYLQLNVSNSRPTTIYIDDATPPPL